MKTKLYLLLSFLSLCLIQANAQISLDSSFATNGIKIDTNLVTNPAIYRYEKMLELNNGTYIGAGLGSIHKILGNGQFDPTFGSNGSSNFPIPSGFIAGSVNALAKQRDGKIVVLATIYYPNFVNPFFAVFRYQGNGQIDNSFHNNGILIDSLGVGQSTIPATLAIDTISNESADYIYFGGQKGTCTVSGTGGSYCANGFFMCKLTPNGNYDPSFHQTGIWQDYQFPVGSSSPYYTNFVNSIHILSKSSVLITGYSSTDFSYFGIKLDPFGNIKTSFGNNGLWKLLDPNNSPITFTYSKRLGPQNILFYKNSLYSTDSVHVSYFCMDTSGQTVNSFGTNGIATFSLRIYKGPGIAFANLPTTIDQNKNIYTSFYKKTSTTTYLHILKVKPNGQQDLSFGTNGIYVSEPFSNDYCLNGNMSYDMLCTKDNKLLVSIYKDLYSYSGGGMLRYKGLGTPLFTPSFFQSNVSLNYVNSSIRMQTEETGMHQVLIYSSNGALVYQKSVMLFKGQTQDIQLPYLSKGMYICKAQGSTQYGFCKFIAE